ncbi:Uncharacterised protein [Mycobacteroides abscessus subsp. abscessus]|uniref:hypothetical protein n=1 Tax=Mycobacteroides abscessus TaxID=36809 RepID=UPI0009272B80|nr:hypothetical protein [Mycobacteroides abscessus]SIH19395.1 Uncharacterised protein [Mycobacteroides abscessus subsp. abscessus]
MDSNVNDTHGSGRTYVLVTDEGRECEGGTPYEYVIDSGWSLLDGLQVAKAIHQDRRPGTDVIDWSIKQPAETTRPR